MERYSGHGGTALDHHVETGDMCGARIPNFYGFQSLVPHDRKHVDHLRSNGAIIALKMTGVTFALW